MLEHSKISYDLLSFLFKPNDPVYTTCFGTEKPHYIKYNAGKEKTEFNEEKFYQLDYQYFDFDDKIIGEVLWWDDSTTVQRSSLGGALVLSFRDALFAY